MTLMRDPQIRLHASDLIMIVAAIDETNSETKTEEGGGCLIATAAYGSEMAPQIQQLRELRDNTILSTQFGTAFMIGFNQIYYSFELLMYLT